MDKIALKKELRLCEDLAKYYLNLGMSNEYFETISKCNDLALKIDEVKKKL
jgi:hypothetical protein